MESTNTPQSNVPLHGLTRHGAREAIIRRAGLENKSCCRSKPQVNFLTFHASSGLHKMAEPIGVASGILTLLLAVAAERDGLSSDGLSILPELVGDNVARTVDEYDVVDIPNKLLKIDIIPPLDTLIDAIGDSTMILDVRELVIEAVVDIHAETVFREAPITLGW